MKTLILLSCCRTAQTTEWSPLINALPGICWGIIIFSTILVGYYIYMRFKWRTDHVNQHEIKMKNLLNEYEGKMISINQDIKDRELHRKIREYNELTKLINNEDLDRKIREYNELTKLINNEDLERKVREYNELTKLINNEDLDRKIREYNELTKLINNEDLDRKIREYNELTIHKTLLEKATGIDKDFDDLKKVIEEMKKKYESLDGEIEKIIVK